MDFRKNDLLDNMIARYIATFELLLDTGDFIPEDILMLISKQNYKFMKSDYRQVKKEYRKMQKLDKQELRKLKIQKFKDFMRDLFKKKQQKQSETPEENAEKQSDEQNGISE